MLKRDSTEIVAGILLLVVSLFVLFFLYRLKKEKPNTEQYYETNDSLRTYINPNYGFSFKYPPSVRIEDLSRYTVMLREGDASARLEIVSKNLFESTGFAKYQNPTLVDFAKYAAEANYGAAGPTGMYYLDDIQRTVPVNNLEGNHIMAMYFREVNKHWPEGIISKEVVTEKTVGPIYAIDAEIYPDIGLILLLPEGDLKEIESLGLILESFIINP
jgi:hypothetical protein